MKLMKIIGALGVAVILFFVFVANFSVVESSFQCPGEISFTDGSRPLTVYIKLEKYRWWVGLWSESEGLTCIEVPNTYFECFDKVKKQGDWYVLLDDSNRLKGYFSILSKILSIQLPIKLKTDFFEGTCKKID